MQDTDRVQRLRAESWIRFDTKQLSIVFDCAFQHLSRGDRSPFDFSKYRQDIELPESVVSHISQFLNHCLSGDDKIQRNFEYAANVVGSSLVRRLINLDRGSKCNTFTLVDTSHHC